MEKIEAPLPGFKLLATLDGGGAWFGRVAWSADGKKIAAGSSDEMVRIWDAETGNLIRQLKGGKWSAVSFSWTGTNRLLTCGPRKSSSARIWSIDDGRIHLRLAGSSGEIRDVGCSADGRIISIVTGDRNVRFWDASTGQPLQCTEEPYEVAAVNWSPVDCHLAIRGEHGGLWLRDAESGEFLSMLAGRPDNPVSCLAWSPDGKLLAGAFWDDTAVLLWNAESGRFFKRLEGHRELVKSVSFSADGTLLASKSSDNTVRLWRTDDWSTVSMLPEYTSRRWPPTVAFHPLEPILATLGAEDTTLRIWRLDLLSKKTERARQALRRSVLENRNLIIREKAINEWVLVRGDKVSQPQANRHLRQGFFQRHQMMSASRRRIFDETHNRENQLDPDLTVELNVHVNAYYLNLCGALDNLAWMLAHALELLPALDEDRSEHRRFCNLFGGPFLEALGLQLPDLRLRLQTYRTWNREIRLFRDPAAHRVPLYMTPGIITDDTATAREELERKASEATLRGDSHEYMSLFMAIRSLAVYVPAMITSESAGLKMYSLHDQLPKDQETFLDIATLVLHELLGPFLPLLNHMEWAEEDDLHDTELE